MITTREQNKYLPKKQNQLQKKVKKCNF